MSSIRPPRSCESTHVHVGPPRNPGSVRVELRNQETRRMPETFLVDLDGHVLTVTLNRPEQRNAFSDAMRREMASFWQDLRGDRSVRCIVLTGAGKGFCAGADMEG